MHATNNGPACKSSDPNSWGNDSNMTEFREAGIPFARTHDSSYYYRYGLEHTVDVHAIFSNFDCDPYDPEAYDFTCTDNYLETIEAAGHRHCSLSHGSLRVNNHRHIALGSHFLDKEVIYAVFESQVCKASTLEIDIFCVTHIVTRASIGVAGDCCNEPSQRYAQSRTSHIEIAQSF